MELGGGGEQRCGEGPGKGSRPPLNKNTQLGVNRNLMPGPRRVSQLQRHKEQPPSLSPAHSPGVGGDTEVSLSRFWNEGLTACGQLLCAEEAAGRSGRLGDHTAHNPRLFPELPS